MAVPAPIHSAAEQSEMAEAWPATPPVARRFIESYGRFLAQFNAACPR